MFRKTDPHYTQFDKFCEYLKAQQNQEKEMSEEVANQIRLVQQEIDKLKKYEMTSRIHCSKVNSILNAFFSLRPLLNAKLVKKKGLTNKKLKKLFKQLTALIDDLFHLIEDCSNNSPPEFQDFLLTNSIKTIFDRFFTIRQTTIDILSKIGLDECVSLFQITPEMLYNQNHVDLKRIYILLLQLQSCRKLYESPVLLQCLNDRLQSMAQHGFEVPDILHDSLDVPKANNLIIQHNSIHFVTLIGTGRSAFVHSGTIGDSPDLVAIKVLRGRTLSPPELMALRREVSVLSSLSHPSLLKLKYYTNDPPFCLVTDFIPNGSLYAYLRTSPEKLTPTDRTIIAIDVATGMAYMHEQRIIHRDLKSLNIMLDENKRAKIGDFGLSRVLNFEPMSGFVGTAQWMAPEVYLSQPLYDSKVDVFSFGIVLWELLTSKIPYDGFEDAAIPRLVVHENLRPEIPAGTPRELGNLISSCWAADPKERPSFQQIVQRFSSSNYYFPGTDISLIPRNNIRHAVSNSDPLKLTVTTQPINRVSISFNQPPPLVPRKCKARITSSSKLSPKMKTGSNMVPKPPIFSHRLKDDNLIQVYEAISSHNETKFDGLISTLRANVNQKNYIASPDNFINDLFPIMEKSEDRHRSKLIRVLDEALKNEDIYFSFIKVDGSTSLAHLLEQRTEETSRAFFHFMENHRQFDMFPIPIIRTLLSFYDYPNIKIRSRALKILFFVCEQQRTFLCSVPTFIAHMLDFAQFQLQENLLETLLNTILDLLSGIDTLPDSIIDRVQELFVRVPNEHHQLVIKIVESILRFQRIREQFPIQLWMQANNNFNDVKSFFTCFIETPPENSDEMIFVLIQAARDNVEALSVLVDMAKSTKTVSMQIMSHMPLINRENDELLLKLYSNLINVGGLTNQVYQQEEFYSVCFELIKNGFHDSVYKLLSNESINFELTDHFDFVNVICQTVMDSSDADILWSILNVVYKWLKERYNPKFEVIIPKLHSLLRGREAASKLGAFLCLIIISNHSVDKINLNDLMIAAMFYISQGTEPVQEVCNEFILNNKTVLSQNLVEMTGVFLKFYKEDSSYSSSIVEMLRKIDRKQKHILTSEDHQKLVSYSKQET